MAVQSRDQSLAPALAAAVLALLLAARLASHFPLPLPLCGFRVLTHIPCPGCGATRCLVALSHGHFRQALAFNPLVAVGCLAVFVWLGVWAWERCRGRPLVPAARRLRDPRRLGLLLLVALLGNWAYLIFALPHLPSSLAAASAAPPPSVSGLEPDRPPEVASGLAALNGADGHPTMTP